jgi:hypothetical protein
MNASIRSLAILVTLALLTTASRAEDALRPPEPAPPRPFSDVAIGFMGGPLFPGSISVGDLQPDTNLGLVGRFAIDAMVAPKLSVGGYALIASTGFQNTDLSARSYGFGATLKGHFPLGPGEVRPGLTVAFQLSDMEGGDLVKGLGVGAILEGAYPVAPHVNLLLHTGFLSQPAGGTGDVDVTWGPIFYFATGLEFPL